MHFIQRACHTLLFITHIYECNEFEAIDETIIRYISELMLNGIENFDFIIELIETRRKKHWYKNYTSIYETLYYGIKIREFEKQNNLKILNSKDVYKKYVDNYYIMDYYYRKFLFSNIITNQFIINIY